MERDGVGSKRPESLRDRVQQHQIDKLEELPPEVLSTLRRNPLAKNVAHRQVEAALEQGDQKSAQAFEEAEKALKTPRKLTPAQIALKRTFMPRHG